LPNKNRISLTKLVPLSILALLAGYGIGELNHLINPEIMTTPISGTPKPGTSARNDMSTCLDFHTEVDCVQPMSLETTLNQIVYSSQMLLESKDQMSNNSFSTLFNSANILYYAITDFLNNDPNAIDFFTNESLFREASGGSTINNWQRATTTPDNRTAIPYQTPGTISISPEQHLYLPQIRVDKQGFPIIDIENIEAISTHFHEWFHGAQAIQDWKNYGTFFKDNQPYINSKYTGLYSQEEYQAEFYGDIAKIAMLKRYGLIDQYYKQLKDDIGMKNNGTDLSSIAYFLDQNGITPENPLWPLLYDVSSIESLKYHREMYRLTGDQQYQDKINETIAKWQNYPWSAEEIELVQRLIDQGLLEGWILPDSIPSLPETSSTI